MSRPYHRVLITPRGGIGVDFKGNPDHVRVEGRAPTEDKEDKIPEILEDILHRSATKHHSTKQRPGEPVEGPTQKPPKRLAAAHARY